MPREADRVAELSTSTGTGSMTLSGATTGHRTWAAAFGESNTSVHYGIVHDGNGTWESGIGTFLPGSGALQRDIVLASSSAGSKVSFASGSKVVYCQAPAETSRQVRVRRSTDIGLEIIGAASQSANPISVKNSGSTEVFSVSPAGKITSAGGMALGSTVAPGGVTDLSRHIALWGATYGFNVTNARLNYNAPSTAQHDFYLGTALVAEIGATGVEASLIHKQSGGYFRIGAYNTASYGTGNARLWYNATTRRLTMNSDNSGSVSQLNVDLGSIRLSGGSPQIIYNETDAPSLFYRLGAFGTGSFYLQKSSSIDFPTAATLWRYTNATEVHDFYTDGVFAAQIAATGTTASGGGVLMTRQKGDARYAAISSQRYKDDIEVAERIIGFLDLDIHSWTFGGELEESDFRRGRAGYGHVAEEVAVVFPEGVENDDEDRPDRLNVGAMLGALHAELKAAVARIDSLEA